MEKIWQVAPRKFDDLVDQLLYNRGVIKDSADPEAEEHFFEPDFARDLHDPFLLTGLEKAIERIKQAKEKGEKIGIFADYDADGIPGAALLYKAFRKIGFEVEVYIPNRESGYGLSVEGIDLLIQKGCTLLITVDLGIRSIKEALYCKKKGIDLIVTDHHLPGADLPEAYAVINPKIAGNRYPYKDLCGCGVAFKLVQGMSKYFLVIDESFLKWNLDLVAISTISDVVPLSGENRAIAKYGLLVMRKSQNIGIKKLIEVSHIDSKIIGAYQIGFQIGPRINAPGRIDHATKSFDLLVTEDEKEANELAAWLDEKNTDRQVAMDETEKEASAKIDKYDLAKGKIIIVAGHWQKGVIGPTASRLVEKYSRPVILFSQGDILTGSARSVSGVDIVDIFEKAKDNILKFGGHKGAAGISVEKDKYDKFIQDILEIANREIAESDLIKSVKIDALVKLAEMTKSLYEKLIKFEPFGMGNSRPTFASEGITFENFRFVGNLENHFSAKAVHSSSRLKSIYFNFPYEKNTIIDNQKYDIVYTLNLDEWNGQKQLSLNINEMKVHE